MQDGRRRVIGVAIGVTGLVVGAAAWSSGCDADEDTATISSSLLARGHTPEQSFTLFESGPVRPLALPPAAPWLYATNPPDTRRETFRARRRGPEPVASVPVGLEPVAVAE